MNESISNFIAESFDKKLPKASECPALTLAYVGDCIYELIIRTLLVSQGITHVNKLNKLASNLVKASAQCELYHCIQDKLTEEENSAFKRGRNAKSGSKAKNATVSDYRIATGMEALMGYLYLEGKLSRITELLKQWLDSEDVCTKE